MTPEEVQKSADELRAEAKRHFNGLMGYPENISSENVDRIVDCIISAAMLEVAALNAQAVNQKP